MQTNFFSHSLQIYCSGSLSLGPFLFWAQSKIGPYNLRHLWEFLDLIRKRFWFSAQNVRVRFASTDDRATSG